MSKVYISGHLNPDMDSICSAYAYANLKNIIDPLNAYEAIRCGQLNLSTKRQFEKLNLEPPIYVKDIKIRLKDIAKVNNPLDSNTPLYDLISIFSEKGHSVIPVFTKNKFKGLLTIDNITNYFLKESTIERPVYNLSLDNIDSVIPGKFFYKNLRKSNLKLSILVGSMHFDTFKKRCKKLKHMPVLITGNREKHINYAIKNDFPLIVITGLEKNEKLDFDLSKFNGSIYISDIDTSQTIRMLRLCEKVSSLIQKEDIKLEASMLFDEGRKELIKHDIRGASVYDGDKWIGYITRASFLDKPEQKLILVDHNEVEQSIEGSEDATIVEIIDHHRFNPRKTKTPIFIASEPLGSTCSIVYNLYIIYLYFIYTKVHILVN